MNRIVTRMSRAQFDAIMNGRPYAEDEAEGGDDGPPPYVPFDGVDERNPMYLFIERDMLYQVVADAIANIRRNLPRMLEEERAECMELLDQRERFLEYLEDLSEDYLYTGLFPADPCVAEPDDDDGDAAVG